MLTVEVRVDHELRALLTAWELVSSPADQLAKSPRRNHCFECYQPGLRLVEGEVMLLAAEGALGMVKQLAHEAQWTSGKVEVPFASLASEDRIEHLINHVRDQVAKRQYLNATSWAVELVTELQRRLSEALKGGVG